MTWLNLVQLSKLSQFDSIMNQVPNVLQIQKIVHFRQTTTV